MDFGSGEVLVGVTSFLAYSLTDGVGDADYGDFSGAIRTSSHVGFIQGVTGIAPANVPEPSSSVLLLTLATACGAWRCRRTSILEPVLKVARASCPCKTTAGYTAWKAVPPESSSCFQAEGMAPA